MKIHHTPIKDLVIIEPTIFNDERGYFFESFSERKLNDLLGSNFNFVQDNQAKSVKNVLRGLHFQKSPHAQTKLVRVLQGVIWDVVVDLRKDSETYGQWYGVEISDSNKLQFLVPKGFAHGYSVLSETSEILYKCDDYYSKESEGGLLYNDPNLNIDWKIDLKDAIVSEKDLIQCTFKDIVPLD